jgi:tetratricopeptide (TPR) repeat protein
MVDRVTEMDAFRSAISRADRGSGSLLLLRGEAGIGKTRLAEEAVSEARRRGFEAALGVSLQESATIYHPWSEALGALGLGHLMRDEPPPRLVGLYLLTSSGLVAAKAERAGDIATDPELFGAMTQAVGAFLEDALARGAGIEEGDVLRFARGGKGVCVVRGQGFAVTAVHEGRENELLLRELRRIVDEIGSVAGRTLTSWDGTSGAVAGLDGPLRRLIEGGRWDGIDLAGDGQARRYDVFENVLYGLRRRAARNPVMVALDDLQWADPSSLSLLQYLARNTRNDRILLVGAYRVEGTGVQHHLAECLAGMAREDLGTELPLSGLPRADVDRLASAALGATAVPGEFTGLLMKETEGNPMFVREVVIALREDGALEVAGDGAARLTRSLDRLGIPAKVRDVVVNRLARLSAEERALLDAAAVCGSRFTGTLAAMVLGEPETKTLRALNAVARVHGLVRPVDRTWRFDHPIVREVLYEELSGDLRALYHRVAAESMEGGGAPAEEVGEHFAAAGDPRAVPFLRTAARTASARGSNDEAARFLGRALDVAPSEERASLAEAKADALQLAGRYAEALASIDYSAVAGAPAYLVAKRRSDILDKLSRWDDALESAREALVLAPPVERPALQAHEAWVLLRQGRVDEALASAEQAVSESSGAGPADRGRALHTLAACLAEKGELDRALQLYEEAIQAKEAGGDRRAIPASVNNIGLIHQARGDYLKAKEAYERALGLHEAAGNRPGAAGTLNNLANVIRDLGDLDAAEEFHRRSLAAHESIGDVRGQAMSLHNLGNIQHDRGDRGGAIASRLRSLSACERLGDLNGEGWVTLSLGASTEEQGDCPAARVWFDRAEALARKTGARDLLSAVLASRVPALIACGESDRARAGCEEALGLARATKMKDRVATALRGLGMVAAASGDWAEADRRFGEAVAIFTETGRALETAQTHARWGQAARAAASRTSDPALVPILRAQATDHLAKAAEMLEKRGAGLRAAEAREAIRSLGSERG